MAERPYVNPALTAFRLYAFFDIVLGILFIWVSVKSLNLNEYLLLYMKSGEKGVLQHLLIYSKSDEQTAVKKLIKTRIKEECGFTGKTPDIIIASFKTAVQSTICILTGYAGFILLAIVLAIASYLWKHSFYCYTIIYCLELLFLLVALSGVIVFQDITVCPLNYNITYFKHFPRQGLIFIFGIFLFIYKFFEIMSIHRYTSFLWDDREKEKRQSVRINSISMVSGSSVNSVAHSMESQMTSVLSPSEVTLLREARSIEDIETVALQIIEARKTRPDVSINIADFLALRKSKQERGHTMLDFLSKKSKKEIISKYNTIRKSLSKFVPLETEPPTRNTRISGSSIGSMSESTEPVTSGKPEHISMNSEHLHTKPEISNKKTPEGSAKPRKSHRKTPEFSDKPEKSSRKTLELLDKPEKSSRKTPELLDKPRKSLRKAPEFLGKPKKSLRKTPEFLDKPGKSPRKTPELLAKPRQSPSEFRHELNNLTEKNTVARLFDEPEAQEPTHLDSRTSTDANVTTELPSGMTLDRDEETGTSTLTTTKTKPIAKTRNSGPKKKKATSKP